MEDSVKNIDNASTSAAKTNIAVSDDVIKDVNSQQKTPENSAAPEKKKHRTLGNKVYDFLVFAPIAWGGVWAASAVTGYQAIHGTSKNFGWLRDMNSAVGKWIETTLTKTVMKKSSEKNVQGMAKNIGLVFILGMGSHALVAPIKWLEDRRQSNAAKIDKLLGTTPPDAQAIKEEPKQGWGSVISGRLASWATAFVALGAMGPKLVEWNDKFGEQVAKKWMSFRVNSKHNPTKVRNWANLLAFDFLGTAVTAAVTYVFSRFVAESFGKKENVADTVYELNPVAPNPFGDEAKEPHKKHSSFAHKVKAENKPISIAEPNMAYVDKVKNESGASRVLT